MSRLFAYSLAAFLSTSLLMSANQLMVRLNPSSSAPVIKRIDEADPIFKRAITITNSGLAKLGWMRSSDLLIFDGYLSTEQLSKNFEIEINAKVYPQASLNGPHIARVQDGDPIELLEMDDQWARIRIEKEMPVYFQLGTSRAPTPVYIAPTRATAVRVDTTRFDPNLSVGATRPDQLPPENVVWRSATGPAPSDPNRKPIASIQRNDVAPITKPPVQADGRIYRLSGQLIRKINSEAPRYTLHLENTIGERIAYVDVSQMYLEDIHAFLDHTVYIHGEVSALSPASQSLVILARTIRKSSE